MSYSGDEIKARGADFIWLVSAEEKAAAYRAAVKKRLYNAIHTAFPEFRSVFEDADQAYIALSELGSYVVFNIHQEPLRARFFDFVNAEYAQADEETRYFSTSGRWRNGCRLFRTATLIFRCNNGLCNTCKARR